ncbi:MAG: Holliday junction branch migration protein RuvA [Kiritimatiellae bacterium]|nr:Holliday junction branch migration protein RuvA [Kiritimatiellia bacterium]
MIAYISGTLAEKSPARIVVEACGVGYEMSISLSTYDALPACSSPVKIYAYHHVREDGEMLFGFAAEAEKDMFVKLTGVSGVGPKIALAILSGLTLPDLSLAIASGEARRISAVKGVGKKTAEKICVELRDKVNAFEAMGAKQGSAKAFLRDAVLALSALGYGDENASKMVSQVIASHPDAADTETVIRLALAGR